MGDKSTSHIDAVKQMHDQGYRVSLAGGIGPDNLDAALAVKPEIFVVGSAITGIRKSARGGRMDTRKNPRIPALVGRGTRNKCVA